MTEVPNYECFECPSSLELALRVDFVDPAEIDREWRIKSRRLLYELTENKTLPKRAMHFLRETYILLDDLLS